MAQSTGGAAPAPYRATHDLPEGDAVLKPGNADWFYSGMWEKDDAEYDSSDLPDNEDDDE